MRYAEVPDVKCRERIETYLRQGGVEFDVREHPLAFTAQEVAGSEHVKGRAFAKVVMVVADGEMRMIVLPASEKLSFERLTRAIRAKNVRLASEDEFAGRFADCDPGAMPPFGHLYGLSVVMDDTLATNERIVFRLGSHTTTMTMRYDDFQRIEKPRLADLGVAPIAV
ncbi:MAG: YbaK/EbsC family protein [Chloroflexota bacterium]|nr:YbaK/EbsC family protein [Chloroflexota bacterium]MDE3101119.1 YbaK/EbsC family protein [Chloroflexota bacterium]